MYRGKKTKTDLIALIIEIEPSWKKGRLYYLSLKELTLLYEDLKNGKKTEKVSIRDFVKGL